MGKVKESIWTNGQNIIPMAEVSYIEELPTKYDDLKNQIRVIFKHSKWNNETQSFEPNVYLNNNAALSFKKEWCNYRSELESETIMNFHPLENAAQNLQGFFNDIQNICKEYKQDQEII